MSFLQQSWCHFSENIFLLYFDPRDGSKRFNYHTSMSVEQRGPTCTIIGPWGGLEKFLQGMELNVWLISLWKMVNFGHGLDQVDACPTF